MTAEPFEELEEYTTEADNTVEVGKHYKIKPTYVKEALPAELMRIYHDPVGFSGKMTVVTAVFRYDIPDGHEYDHMDEKIRKVEYFNLDFVVFGESEFNNIQGGEGEIDGN